MYQAEAVTARLIGRVRRLIVAARGALARHQLGAEEEPHMIRLMTGTV